MSCPECSQVFRFRISGSANEAAEPGNGELAELGPPIDTPSLCDNIEWDEATNRIYCGAIPQPLKDGKAYPPLIAPGEIIAIPAPSSNSESPWPTNFEYVLTHDGRKLNQFSAGIVYGNKVVAGSPFNDGVLVCTI